MTAPVTPEPIRVKILPSEVDKSTITKALFSIAVTATTIAVMTCPLARATCTCHPGHS